MNAKVEHLVDSLKPMINELEEFKTKVASFQDTIRKGMDDVLCAKPTHRTSVAAYCRLSEEDREQHRQLAGNRRQELAENWDLSRITEASASRARISVDMNQSMYLSHLPDTSDCGDQITTTQDVFCVASGASGDQAAASSPVKQDSPAEQILSPVLVEPEPQTDELTDLKEMAKPKAVRKRAIKLRAKKEAEAGDDVVVDDEKKKTAAKPRKRKVAKPEDVVVGSDENSAKLRPRRKGVNYTDK